MKRYFTQRTVIKNPFMKFTTYIQGKKEKLFQIFLQNYNNQDF